MAATVYTSSAASSLEFGITDETSIILTSFSRNVQSVKTEVRNAANDVVGVAHSGITAAISLEGYVNGTVSMAIAATLTLNNDTTRYGLTGGTVITDSISESTGQGEFAKISISATQYSETLTV
tara:strand:+ start:35 stop:406 length:372 start_codon:yes stop_codon:yes gene_type:complete